MFFIVRFNGSHVSKGTKDHQIWVAGSMTDWKAVQMSRPEGESDFLVILDATEGQVFFKVKMKCFDGYNFLNIFICFSVL